MTNIDDLLAHTTTLKPLSPTATKLARIVGDENSTIKDAVSVIAYDQAATANVLRLANSAMSASSRHIETVHQAVIRLGTARILEHIIGYHVKESLCAELPVYGYEENELWHHSVCAACASELLNGFTNARISGLSFTAALLHDIGKLIISRGVDPDDIRRIMAHADNTPCAWADAEREILGFSHADLGARLCEQWQLPDRIVYAIRTHHDGAYTGDVITDSVRIANITAKCVGVGLGREGMQVTIEADCAQRLDMHKEQFEKLCADTAYKYTQIISSFVI